MEPLPLKDIHLPETIGWWPPAPGWWLVVILGALIVTAGPTLFRTLRKRLTRHPACKQALRQIARLRQQPIDDPQKTLAELSALIRRVAMTCHRREEVASLRGEDWLAFLDRNLPDAPFSQGPGRYLADAHYRPDTAGAVDLDSLFVVCERWLNQQGKAR